MSDTDWGAPVHAPAPPPAISIGDWGDPVHHDAPVKGATKENPLDIASHAAPASLRARASLAPDIKVQLKHYAEGFKQPEEDFAIVDDRVVRRIPSGPDAGKWTRVEESVRGAKNPLDAAERAFDWVSGGAGPAIPAVASGLSAAGAGLATLETGPGAVAAAMAAGGAGAAGGETFRQKLDAWLAGKGKAAPMDWGNVGWQTLAGVVGPVAGKVIEGATPFVKEGIKAAGRVAAGEMGGAGAELASAGVQPAAEAAGSAASYGLSPRVVSALKEHIEGKQAELDQLRREAQEHGVDLSLAQLTDAEAAKTSERQLLRQPETMQKVANLRKAQDTEQIPGAVQKVLDDIAPTPKAPVAVESAVGKPLTDSERESVQFYTADASGNHYLRTGKQVEDPDADPADLIPKDVLDKHVANMDAVFEKTPPIEKDIELYRGIQDRDGTLLSQFEPGKTFIDKGFSSTSSAEEIAHGFAGTEFAEEEGHTPIVLRIRAPAGSKVVDVNNTIDHEDFSGIGPIEEEHILPRNSTFTIDSVEKLDDGTHVVHATLNPPVKNEVAAGSNYAEIPEGKQVEEFRKAGESVVTQAVKERKERGGPLYEAMLKGGSIAPLEDQYRQAVMQATAEKASIAKQLSAMEKTNPKALAGKGSVGQHIRDKYADLQAQASEVEEARLAMLERFKQAQADKTANAPGAVWSERIQQFIDDPDTKPAISRGLRVQRLEALADGRPHDPTEYAIVGGDEANPVVGKVPNMRLLDAIKKGYDAIIADHTDKTTGIVDDIGRATTLVKQAYLKEVDHINPGYAKARAQWGTDSEAINAIKEGGVGFLNSMTGADRQDMINNVFRGKKLLADDVADMRRQFLYAGKEKEWNAAFRSFISDNLADAMRLSKQGGNPNNVAGGVYANLFDPKQLKILKAAMGYDDAKIAQWEKLGRVLKAASIRLPEGTATPTDLGTPGLAKRSTQALGYMLRPTEMASDIAEGLEKMQKIEEAKKMAETLLTPKGDKLLKELYPTTPGTPKANSILTKILTTAGVISAEQKLAPKADDNTSQGWSVERVN